MKGINDQFRYIKWSDYIYIVFVVSYWGETSIHPSITWVVYPWTVVDAGTYPRVHWMQSARPTAPPATQPYFYQLKHYEICVVPLYSKGLINMQ